MTTNPVPADLITPRTIIDTNSTTIREWLAAHHERPELVDCSSMPTSWLDRPVSVQLVLGYNIRCGGDVLVDFRYKDVPYRTRPANLIRDDSAGERWDTARRDVHAGDTSKTVTALGSRPWPAYRIVQTA